MKNKLHSFKFKCPHCNQISKQDKQPDVQKLLTSRVITDSMEYLKFAEHLMKSCPAFHFICPFFCSDKLYSKIKLKEHLDSGNCKN